MSASFGGIVELVSVGKCKACTLKRSRSKGSLLLCGDTTRSEVEVNASEITEARGYRSCAGKFLPGCLFHRDFGLQPRR